jgi:hypothetical protein
LPPDQTPSAEHPPDDDDAPLAAEVRFVAAWESGSLPFLGAIVRVRQIYRANPLIFNGR